jgi:EAL domain-containing protein (putative c-di-GMP-specific phosphodiesterase class I)
MSSNTPDHKETVMDIRRGLEQGEFYLVYQPILDARSEKIQGVEALCRWRRPQGETPPATFIAFAEACGLIEPLGLFVLRQACRDARAWRGLTVSVNISPKQLEQEQFPETIRKVLAETGLEPSRLELELTENVPVVDLDGAHAKMRALQSLGVRLGLDDFGAGHSSLNYLLALPFDRLKIDRHFISKLGAGVASAAIIHAIVSMGRALGMHITGEGIETAEQQQFLRVAGVHSFQGFRFSRPVEASEISSMLAAQQALDELRPSPPPLPTPPMGALGLS